MNDYCESKKSSDHSIEPNILNMLNLFTMIYNKNNSGKSKNLVSDVMITIPNDTSRIQEEFNMIINEHSLLDAEDPDNTIIYDYDEDINDSSSNNKYVLIINSKTKYYSMSRLSLLAYGSTIIDKCGYDVDINIIAI